MSEKESRHSVTQRKRRFTVTASPMNAIKLELALICLVAILLWLLQGRIIRDPAAQLLLLGGYGLVAMMWIVFRVRYVLSKINSERGHHGQE